MKLYNSENLKRLCKEKGLTQEQLAECLSVSFQAVYKWECEEGYPDIVMLPSIAQVFGVSVDELLGMEKICSQRRTRQPPMRSVRYNLAHGENRFCKNK